MPTPEKGEKGFRFPLKWVVPDDLEGKYATNVLVQHTRHEFVIYFFEVEQPLLSGPEKQREKKLESISEIEAECVAKITISASRFPEIVQTFQRNFEKFKDKFIDQ